MRKKKILVIFLLLFTILLSSFGFYAYQIIYSPNILVDKKEEVFIIPKDATFKDVQNKLFERDIVQDLVSFSMLAKMMNYHENVRYGRYKLQPNMTNIQAIRLLRLGQEEAVNITFNNVRLKEGLAKKITRNIAVEPEGFLQALNEYAENNEHGFNKHNVISMFIPNTYQVNYFVTPEQLIERMHMEYQKFWNEERKAKAVALDLTPQEVSTLASIVQAESIKRSESATIAGLYLNRLERGIPLQADPTLVFATGDFTIKRVLNVHKEIDSPYNTYKYRGLPPGPINMPSIHNIDAVLNPEDHQYLYMVAKEDFSGYHYFSKTLSEHLRKAKKYQENLTREQRKARQSLQN
ncbi:MAG: endolytic transglycosylase MltG [Candidatus Cyclobacteriaceae bacterium M2_1C_046]